MSGINFQKAEFAAAYGTASQLPKPERPEYVFSGRSNVGKSSLINKLCNRKKLAKVSSTPGKTATINFYAVGEGFLVDLPGYGYAKTSMAERKRWDDLINSYFQSRHNIKTVVQLLDCRHEPSKDDRTMLEYLTHNGVPFIVALTKADKLKPTAQKAVAEEFAGMLSGYTYSHIVLTSAEKGMGIPELSDILCSL